MAEWIYDGDCMITSCCNTAYDIDKFEHKGGWIYVPCECPNCGARMKLKNGGGVMRITDNPCRNCTKRSAECRLNCARYKVYHTAKLKEYDKRKQERQQRSDIIGHVIDTISKSKKRNIKHTPRKNDGVNK